MINILRHMGEIKDFYAEHSDRIWEKRFASPDPIRRYAHATQYEAIIKHVNADESVLDSGCGEGVIPILLAKRGIAATGSDLSKPNIEHAKELAKSQGAESLTTFLEADAEHLPFGDSAFDVVISSHVLEHLPDFDQGFRELCRVARKRVIVALPTGLNGCAMALLGGDHGYWKFGKRSMIALPWGFLRVLFGIFGEGVQEGYAGHHELPHIWRYPWVMRRRLKHPEWKLVSFEASTLVMPYFQFLLPFAKFLDKYCSSPVLRNFGYGSIAVFERREF